MLAPVLGGDHRVRDEPPGQTDGVVGEPLGAQVQADGAAALGDGAELRLVVPGLAILGDAGLVVHAELHAVDRGTRGEQTREAGGVVRRQDLRGEPLHHGVPVVVGVLRPDAEGEVQAAPAGEPGDADQHLQVPGALLSGEADGTDLREPGDLQQEGIGRGQVGDLVAEGETQVVVAAARQPAQVLLPERVVVEPGLLEPAVAEEELHAAPGQVRGLDGGSDDREDIRFRRGQLDGARRFEDGVRQAGFVPPADEEPAAGEGLEDQGLRCGGTVCPAAGEAILHGRRSARQADDEGGIRSRGGGGLGGFPSGAEDARQFVEGPVCGRGQLRVDDEVHGVVWRTLGEWMAPAQVGETAEVAVGGDPFAS